MVCASLLIADQVLQTVTSPPYDDKPFDIIFDWTAFSQSSQIPTHWLKFAYEILPIDIRRRFRVFRNLTPNALALRYMRRLYNLTNGQSYLIRKVKASEFPSQAPASHPSMPCTLPRPNCCDIILMNPGWHRFSMRVSIAVTFEIIIAYSFTVDQENEEAQEFEEVYMRHNHPMRVPVIMHIGSTHLRIVTVSSILSTDRC